MTWLLYGIIDILFPSKCLSCGRPVSLSDNYLCGPCRDDIVRLKDKCPRCSGAVHEGECEICSGREFYPAGNISIAEYTGTLKNVMIDLKFRKRRRLHVHLAELGAREIAALNMGFDMVTFVPMNFNKKWKRGFNQSELLARFISKKLRVPHARLLREGFLSITQKDLGYRDRFINVINRYRVTGRKKAAGKKILIVDDVFTTGATINECARVLLDSGAREIFSLTIARASLKKA